MNWIDTEMNEKIYIRLLIVGIIVIVVFLMLNTCSFVIPKNYKLSESTVIDEENLIKNGISKVERGRIALELSGWAYKERTICTHI